LHVNNNNSGDTLRITNATTGHLQFDGLIIGNSGNEAFISNLENSTLSFNTANVPRLQITPAGNTEILGQIKITGGSPGTGKILKSDANGLASWQNAGGVNSINGSLGSVTNSIVLGSSGNLPSIVGSGSNAVTINLPTASTTKSGVLSSTNFSSFTNKLNGTGAINQLSKFSATNTVTNSQISDNGVFVGIGTNSPSAKLEVSGQIKMTGGNPGNGKILISDASGLASWQTVSAVGLQGPIGATGPQGL
jgi:hypothetical protein